MDNSSPCRLVSESTWGSLCIFRIFCRNLALQSKILLPPLQKGTLVHLVVNNSNPIGFRRDDLKYPPLKETVCLVLSDLHLLSVLVDINVSAVDSRVAEEHAHLAYLLKCLASHRNW